MEPLRQKEWVPDDEVNSCPICHASFGSVIGRKHHCRNCGRVVCGLCSVNQFILPGEKSPERVCNPCYDNFTSVRHDEAAMLKEKETKNRQQEASFKKGLREKLKDAESFKTLIQRIVSEAKAAGISATETVEPVGTFVAGVTGDDSSCTPEFLYEGSDQSMPSGQTPDTNEGEALRRGPSNPREKAAELAEIKPELKQLIMEARALWRASCKEVRIREDDIRTRQDEINRLSEERQQRGVTVKALHKEVRSMKSELEARPHIEAERDLKMEEISHFRQDIEGLLRRREKLRADRPAPSSSVSDLRSFNSEGGGESTYRERWRLRWRGWLDQLRALRATAARPPESGAPSRAPGGVM